MANVGRKKGRSGDKKHGRNKVCCEIYRKLNRRLKSKARKLKKHITRHPNDGCAQKALAATGI